MAAPGTQSLIVYILTSSLAHAYLSSKEVLKSGGMYLWRPDLSNWHMQYIELIPIDINKKTDKGKKKKSIWYHPNDDRSLLSPRLHLPIYRRAQTVILLGATTEWMALCQLLPAINRIRSLFPLFARPLSLSVRLLPTLLLSLMFLLHTQDIISFFGLGIT